ncbi:puff II/9-1 protein-like [Phlebotomus argentipes]|uniref:puff II/9-1 protein-like n=1 Tax=Phlebotomus argentipes TaxID=94469 RepID=UPI002893736F|nr:puff II/9-1 protein-like [Phlebotomus argentipes]
MALRELIEEWNKVMPMINERQLLAPTEEFLITCCGNILNRVNLKVPQNLASEDKELQKKARLKLCHMVDNLYKLSEKKNGFFYLDLLEPSPKRTLHLLQNLLNYVLFYEMMKEEMMSKCKDKFARYEELKTRKIILQGQVEELKILQENQKQQEKDLRAQNVELSAEISRKKAIHDDLEERMKLCVKKTEELKKKHMDLQMDMDKMRVDLIPKEEIDSLEKQLEMAQKDTEELKITIATIKANTDSLMQVNKNIAGQLAVYEDFLKDINQAGNFLEATESCSRELDAEINELKQELEDKTSMRKCLMEAVEARKSELAGLKEDLRNCTAQHNKEILKQQQALKAKMKDNAELEKSLADHIRKLIQMRHDSAQAEHFAYEMLRMMK